MSDINPGRALIERVQAGDRDAFGQIYTRYKPFIHGFIRHRVWDVQLAEDLTQEVFLRALKNVGRFQWQGKDPRAWLTTIARNVCADHHSSSYQRLVTTAGSDTGWGALPDDSREGDVEGLVIRALRDNSALLRAWSSLTGEQQEVLELRHLRELSIRDTAQRMCRTEGAIKSLTHRASRSLAAALADPDRRPSMGVVRRWAIDSGIQCPERGRIPTRLFAAYQQETAA